MSYDAFEDAQRRVKLIGKPINPAEMLELYALYKQATAGDATGSRPGMLDLRGRAKFDAWHGHLGMSKAAAMDAYCALVAKLGA